MPNDDIELMAKASELGKFEDLSIIIDNFGGITKTRQYFLLHKFDYHCVYSIFGWDGLYPFGEVIHGRKYPLVLAIGWWVYLYY